MLFNCPFASIATLGESDESSDVLKLLFRQPAGAELGGLLGTRPDHLLLVGSEVTPDEFPSNELGCPLGGR